MRGTLCQVIIDSAFYRITPAHAGNTAFMLEEAEDY